MSSFSNSVEEEPSIDQLSYIIQEITMITSIMRKATSFNQSSNNPLSVLLNKNVELSILPNNLSNSNLNTPNGNSDDSRLAKFLNFNSKPKEEDNNHFLSNFIELRSILSEINSIDEIDMMTLLQPFLILIKSPNTSNQITSIAINSLSKFVKYKIITSQKNNIEQSLQQIVTSLAHCKFEGLDQVQDDILLIKILQLVELIILTDDLSDLLNDDSMYEAISTCFSLSINSRRREILRSSAETTLLLITEKVFKKLFRLSSEFQKENHNKKNAVELTNADLPKDTIGTMEKSESIESTPQPEGEEITEASSEKPEEQQEEDQQVETEDLNLTSYGIPCLKEFLSHTIDILSPDNRLRFTESSRILALNIINTIIEVSNKVIYKYPSLFSLISSNLCHHLIIIVQTDDSPMLLSASMQLFLNLTLNLYSHLKLQIELTFITISQSIFVDVAEIESSLEKYNKNVLEMGTNGIFKTEVLNDVQIAKLSKEFQTNRLPSTKEIFIETISVLWVRSPLFFINLFKSYDCDFDRSDLCQNLLNILFRLSYSNTTLFITNNVPPLCMEGILSFVESIYERVKLANKNDFKFEESQLLNSDDLLLKQKIMKSDFIECTKQWNKKPKIGLQFFQDKGFIKDKNDIKEVSKFLYEKSGRLDKKQLGETLSKAENKEILTEFVSFMDFKRLRVDEALRVLLSRFRIPGESAQIERFLDVFVDRYLLCQTIADEEDAANTEGTDGEGQEEIEKVSPDKDATYVLSYAIIMLNTDAYNPNVKEPMTFDQFKRNLRGVYYNKDFPEWYLKKIYDGIYEKEIILPEEHKGTSKWFESVWQNLLGEQESKKLALESYSDESDLDHILLTSTMKDYKEILPFDKLLFADAFTSLIGTLITMFDDTVNDNIVTTMMSTVEKCASIAYFFGMHDEVDKILEIVTHMTTLTGIKKPDTSNYDRNGTEGRDKQDSGNSSSLSGDTSNDAFTIPITELKLEKENEIITISDKSVNFGKDFRAQLSSIVLFRIIKKSNFKIYENSWKYIVRLMLTLFENRLLDPNIFDEFQEKLALDKLARPNPQFQINRTKPIKDTGLFSTFSSIFKGLSDDSPEPTDEEIECTLSTVDCLKSSKLTTVFRSLTKPATGVADQEFQSNILTVVKLLLDSLPERKNENLRFFAEESLFIFEVVVCYLLLIDSNDERKKTLVERALDDMYKIFTPMEDFKAATLTRVFCYKLILLQNSDGSENDIRRLQEILKQLSDFLNESSTSGQAKSKDILTKFGNSILQPLEALVTNASWTQAESTKDKNYWALLRAFASNPKNTDGVFKFTENFINSNPKHITPSNFLDILGLLDEISAVGAYGAQWEQEYDKLKSTGHEVEKNRQNPYHELVQCALRSLTLTSQLSKVIITEEFRNGVPETEKEVEPWYPLIEAIAHQCYNPCRELRVHALKLLQSLLVAQDDLPKSSKITSEKILDTGCTRLLVELLRPEVEATDPKGMIKTQYEVLNLACKVVLLYDFENNTETVSKLLTLADKFLGKHIAAKNRAIEAYSDEVLEMMKNVLLVMISRINTTSANPLDFNTLIKLNIQLSLKKVIKEVGLQYQEHMSRGGTPVPAPATASNAEDKEKSENGVTETQTAVQEETIKEETKGEEVD